MPEIGNIKVGADGWPIRYCEDRHGNQGWVGMILPPWDRHGSYDFVAAENRITIYSATDVIQTALDGALKRLADVTRSVAPQVVENVAELLSLPETVVIMDNNGAVARKYGGDWWWVGLGVSFAPALPVTVLWSPEANQ